MIKLLMTAYAFPPAALEPVKPLGDYAAPAITTSTLMKHTNITLVDESIQVPPYCLTISPIWTPLPGLTPATLPPHRSEIPITCLEHREAALQLSGSIQIQASPQPETALHIMNTSLKDRARCLPLRARRRIRHLLVTPVNGPLEIERTPRAN